MLIKYGKIYEIYVKPLRPKKPIASLLYLKTDYMVDGKGKNQKILLKYKFDKLRPTE